MTQEHASLDFTANDQMIVSAAHLIRNEDAAYVGVGLPMFAALLAKRTHAPDCTFVIENGIMRTLGFELPGLCGQTRRAQLYQLPGPIRIYQPGLYRRGTDRPFRERQRYRNRRLPQSGTPVARQRGCERCDELLRPYMHHTEPDETAFPGESGI